MAGRLTIGQQVAAARLVASTIRANAQTFRKASGMRESELEYVVASMDAIVNTLAWVAEHEQAIRDYVRDRRAAVDNPDIPT